MTIRCLYIGELWQGGTCLARAEALRKLGWEVHPFDTTDYYRRYGRVVRGLQHRLLAGPSILSLNRDLLSAFCRGHKPDVIWFDKNRWLYESTMRKIRNESKALLVHYTPDPAFHVHTSRHFRRSLTIYDLCITTKRYELERYRKLGAKHVLFTWQGVDDRFINFERCRDVASKERTGIVFIGHREQYYESVLGHLARHYPDKLAIWGPGWDKLSKRKTPLSACVKGGPILGDTYPDVLSRSLIGIGLLSKLYPDQFTTRSFEIPAAGTMLIAEKTPDHQEIFEEGKDAEFFSTLDELCAKIRNYLADEGLRSHVAQRGREKVLANYRWTSTLATAVSELQNL